MAPFRSRLIAIASAFALVALSTQASVAFQETGSPVTAPGQAEGSATSDPALDFGGSGVDLSGSAAKPSGTVIAIPGIGKLGTLPKLDFGLELLYADDDPATPDADASTSEDVLVRGAIKHRF